MSVNENRGSGQLLQFADLGTRLAVCIAGLTYGGYRLDSWLDTSPIFLITGALLGTAAGMWSVISSVERWSRATSRRSAKEPTEERLGGPDAESSDDV